jgi:hypothetical protein
MSLVSRRGVVRGFIFSTFAFAFGEVAAVHAADLCPSQKSPQPVGCLQALPVPVPAQRLSVDDAEKLKAEYPSGNAPWFLQGGTAPSDVPEEALGLPVTVTPPGNPSGDGFSAKVSTKSWRDNANKDLEKRIGRVKAAGPKDLKMPDAPRQIEPPAELWSSLEVQGVSASGGTSDQSVRGGVGANYKMSPATTLGVSAERGAKKAANDASTGDDEKLSAFMNFKASPIFSIDARTQWQASQPSAATGASAERSEKGSIIVAPRVSHTFNAGKGQTIEPFVNYKRELGIVSAGSGPADVNSAGAGVTVAKPESYSLSVTTDVDKLDKAADRSISGKVQLKLPFP